MSVADADVTATVPLTVPPALEAVGLSKQFGSVKALDDVSLRLERGTVHALLGENGAGKSTLVKCIMGYYRADVGKVSVGGVEANIASPRDAAALGIGMVYQHFTLVEAMTVAENLVLSRQKHPFIFDWAAERAEIAKFMAKMPFRLDPSKPVHTLAAGEKQKLEILKQLYLGSSIVILDEPTSVLTPSEADEVLGLLRGMVKEGRLTVLMISAQVPRGDAVRRRGDGAAPGPHGGEGPGRRPHSRLDGEDDGGRRAATRHRDAPGAQARRSRSDHRGAERARRSGDARRL